MAKIYSFHVLEPTPEADPAEYEAFMSEVANYLRGLEIEGWRSYLAKADRGSRKGQYAIVHEFDGAEARARYYPVEDGDPTAEALQQYFAPFEALGWVDRWNALLQAFNSDEYTDYVVLP
jgi:hypothetical protein